MIARAAASPARTNRVGPCDLTALLRAATRLDALLASLPPRILIAASASAAFAVPFFHTLPLMCAERFAAIAAAVAIPLSYLFLPPRAGVVPTRRLACSRSLEDGATIAEALIVSALLLGVILGGAAVFSGQRQTASEVTVPDSLRDNVAALDVDANALQAYDPTVRAKISSGGTQIWTAPIPGSQDVPTMEAAPATGGVTIIAKDGTQGASVIAPLPQPKPTPQ